MLEPVGQSSDTGMWLGNILSYDSFKWRNGRLLNRKLSIWKAIKHYAEVGIRVGQILNSNPSSGAYCSHFLPSSTASGRDSELHN